MSLKSLIGCCLLGDLIWRISFDCKMREKLMDVWSGVDGEGIEEIEACFD